MKKNQDKVDIAIDLWKKERPDLETSAKSVVGRIIHLQGAFLETINKAFKKLDIPVGEYAVLCTLRVSGKPYQLTPKQILKLVLLSSGGMSNLLERMEKKQHIKRLADPNDRRGVIVKLTDKGKRLVDEAMAIHSNIEQQIITSLTTAECATLGQLLKKMSLHLMEN